MKPTMRDIAKLANVSLSTVSRALTGRGYVSDETYNLIIEACRRHGYDIDRAGNRQEERRKLIGVLTADLHNEFNVHVIDGMTEVAEQHGYEVIVYDAKEDQRREERGLRLFLKLPLCAIAFTPVMYEHMIAPELLMQMERMNLPIVLMDRDLEFSKFDAVFVDNVTGACEAVNAFVRCGHRRIATITGPETSKTGAERIGGYKKGLYLNNLPVIPEYIQSGEFAVRGGYLAMKRLMEGANPPTAVFVANSLMMRGCWEYINEMPLSIPEDVAIISFDEIPGDPHNALSVVAQPMLEIGKIAMSTLLERIGQAPSRKKEIRRTILSPKLHLRGSELLVRGGYAAGRSDAQSE